MVDFKRNHISLIHPDTEVESFSIVNAPAFMFFDQNGTTKLAIEVGTDWIDFDDSELLGGSEAFLRIWGLPVTPEGIRLGAKRQEHPVTSLPPASNEVHAWFFGTVGRRVDKLMVDFPGDKRICMALHIEDVTEETEDAITIVTVDTVLVGEPSELEPPA